MAEAICALSTACFGKLPVGDAVRSCLELGARAVELSAPHPHQPLDELVALCAGLKSQGVPVVLHNYFPAPARPFVLNPAADGEDRDASFALVKDALALARAAQAPVYAVHAGYLGKAHPGTGGEFEFSERLPYETALDRAAAFFTELSPLFSAAGVTLAVENLFPSRTMRHSLCCTFDEVTALLERVPASVGLLLDLGHLNISANIMGFDRQDFFDRCLAVLGPRIAEVHLSENDGEKDEHLAVLDGSWQLAALSAIRAVPREAGQPRVYTLESRRAGAEELRRSLTLVEAALNI